MLCAPVGEVTLQVDILGPKSCPWGGFPHHRYGSSAWTCLAKGKDSCPPLRTRHRLVKQGQTVWAQLA